jgi:hypothetical protein
MGAIVWTVALQCSMKGENTTLLSQNNNLSIMMNASGTKFSGDKSVPQLDIRAGTA